MRLSYTPEEIGAIHDRNENFHGTQADFEKIRLYHSLKERLMDFKKRCSCVLAVDGYDPNVREKHAILWMDFSPDAVMNRGETLYLASIMNESDRVAISTMKEYTRISFIVQNIWMDEPEGDTDK